MNNHQLIKSGVCPYCGAVYSIATGGCAAKCPGMARHQQLVREALDEIEARDPYDENGEYREP